jgi:hypothetical protein
LAKIGIVIGIDLSVVAGARDGNVGEAGVEQVRVDAVIAVNEDPFGGQALRTVTGDGVAVVEMTMLVGFEFDPAIVVEADGQATIGVDRLREGDLAETDEDAGDPKSDERLVTSEVSADAGVIILHFSRTIEAVLSGPDNAGERLFVRELLLAIRSLAPLHLSRDLRDISFEPTLDRFAPLGLKKKIFYLDLGQMSQLDRRGLPRPRHVQEVDKNALLDPIGEHFREDQHFEVGPIEAARIPKVINDIVKFCYDEFNAIVASLSPGGLLEWLVARHESNVSSAANSRLTMATRIACFGQSPEFIQEASRGLSEASEAAVAGRFLIEYVSAQPPSGFRPMSLSVYEALLARAAIIAGYGMVSDIVHFNIAKIEVAMLGAGRLGFSPDQYRAAMDDYGKRFAASQVASRMRLL